MAVRNFVGRLLHAPENFISDGLIDDIREHGLNADRRDFIRKSFAALLQIIPVVMVIQRS